ncbi:MAG: S41 family peptidase [Lachnospiraceae bacterium]|nr:S41 family peptidase [Lachnospiraceae bacterium]
METNEKRGLSKAGAVVLAILAGILMFTAFCTLVLFISVLVKMPEYEPQYPTDVVSDGVSEKFSRIQQLIDEYYLFDREDVDFDTGVLKGYVDALGDPYTVYYTPEEYSALMQTTEGSYSGIGVVVQQDTDGVITVVKPYENAPGYAAGIRKDDIIYAVEGEEVTGVDLNLVVSRIKGQEGTTVLITVYRPSTREYLDLTVTRKVVEIESAGYEMLESHIGYIWMDSFSEPTLSQFMTAYQNLKKQGMTGLIVDIRDNGGGLLSSVVNILDYLLPAGIVTYTVDSDGYRRDYRSRVGRALDVPCVVLVNGNTASASEIFSGCLQDYGQATIVGTTTFGKGIVQSIFDLEDGSALKITVSRYYTPNGVCIHGIGITPDLEVREDPETAEDEQLQEAIRILKQ